MQLDDAFEMLWAYDSIRLYNIIDVAKETDWIVQQGAVSPLLCAYGQAVDSYAE